MPTFNEVAAFKSVLQRKALVGTVLVADYATAALADICTAGGALADLTGYESLGKFTTDGISLANSVEKQEQRGWGDSYPSRIDVTSESSSFSFTAMESKRAVFDAFYNVDQSGVTPNANGSIVFDKPPLPEIRDKRVLALARDVNKSNGLDIYLGVLFPKGNIAQNGDQAFSNSENGLVYPMQASALLDDTEGTAVRLMWGGPGLAALLDDMGYTNGEPIVSGLNPTGGSTAGGTLVTVNGTGFTGASAVKFGATAATSFNVINDSTISAVAPAQAAGTVDVTVTTTKGTSTANNASKFTYA